MPVCIECGHSVPRVIKPDTETVERCGECGCVCDAYLEFGDVQIWIDVVLLRRKAWAHVLFNQHDRCLMYLLMLLSCALEAVVVQSLTVLKTVSALPDDLHGSALYTPQREVRSVQLVRILQSPFLPRMNYPTTLPNLFLFAVSETMLVACVTTLSGNCANRNSSYTALPWFRGAALASLAKLSYILFLIWAMPPSLLPIVDFVYALWLGCAFTALDFGGHWFFPAITVFASVVIRCLFRYFTKWCPQVLF